MTNKTGSILTVSRLVFLLREVVEENFIQVWVEGELSNWARPPSGHCYFTLKDERSQIKGVMFRAQGRLLRFEPRDGMQVICGGRLSVYPQRGEVQLVVESLEPSGTGSLQLAFEQLKERLAAEGLFAAERKRELPPFPRTVGVVTSAGGAAIHDILNVLRRRSAGVRVVLRPVRVQGEGAAAEIAAAIAELNAWGAADVLIVGRGGGSLEDLWAFNEEAVARAIHASGVPVIAAVGHEVDFTIADFVADLRAPTPSAAAELVVKNRLELEAHLDHLLMRLRRPMENRLELLGERIAGLRRRLRSPVQQLALDRQRARELEQRLTTAMSRLLQQREGRTALLASRLDALSPLRTLGRGFSIVTRTDSGEVVRSSAQLQEQDMLKVRFASGVARVRVEETEE